MAKSPSGQKKYDEGLYREALELFERDYADSKSEETFVQIVQTKLMLREYENALKLALKAPKFKDKKWNLLHQILLGKSIERFINNYSSQLTQTEIKGETEPIKRTYNQWSEDLKKIAKSLANENAVLLNLDIESVKSFFYFKDVDKEAMPTVFDWLANELISNYMWGNLSHDERMSLFQKAMEGDEKNRAYARDFWQMQLALAKHSLGTYFYFNPINEATPAQSEVVRKKAPELEAVYNRMDTVRGKAEWMMTLSKFYLQNGEYEKGLKKCRDAIDSYKGISVSECLQIISQVENKECAIKKNRFNSKSEIKIPVVTRNLKEFYVKIYSSVNKTIDENMMDLKKNSRQYLSEEDVKKLISKKPIQEKKFTISPKNKYLNFESEIFLGSMEAGFYTLVVSDTEKIQEQKSFVYASDFRISDIQLLHQLAGHFDPEKSLAELGRKNIPSHHFYVFDNKNGLLLKDIPLNVEIQSQPYTLKTNGDGVSVLNDVWNFQGSQDRIETYSEVLAVAQIGKSVSTYADRYVSKPSFQHLKFITEFDRPIYRPGQKIHMKSTILRRVPFGYEVVKNSAVQVKVMNAQYEMVAEKKLDTNDKGAISWVYDLPLNGMLGQYTFQVEVTERRFQGQGYGTNDSESVRVEEYKRPDYYVDVEKAKSPWIMDKEVSIKVSSKYYYGAPVKKGRVNYSITSQVYFPWYYYRGEDGSDGNGETQTGQGVLDEKGELTISYVPKANGSDSRRYVVKVSVYDESGRSIDGIQSYFASSKDFFINAVTSKDFFKGGDKPSFTIKLEDPNGTQYSSAVDYEVFELKPPSLEEKKKIKKENPEIDYRHGRYSGERTDLKRFFENLEKKSIKKGVWNVTKEKSDFNIPVLPEGVYRVKLGTKDSAKRIIDSELYFMVAENGKKLSEYYIPEITLLSKPEYKIGETATVLFGSSEYSGNSVGFLLKNQLRIDNPIFKTTHGMKVYEFKVTESMFNGTSFVWFSVFDNNVVTGRHLVSVNNDYKSIDVRFDKTATIKPGQNSVLKIVNNSKLKDLDAFVAMYDQSLEFYAQRDQNFLKEVYQNSDWSREASFQHEYLMSLNLEWVHPDLKSMIEKFSKASKYKYKPVLLIDSDRLRMESDYALALQSLGGGSRYARDKESRLGFAGAPGAPMKTKKSEMSLEESSLSAAEPEEKADAGSARRNESLAKDGDSKNKVGSIEVRKDFSETAVFEPFFKLSETTSKLNFKAPDQLTAWKAKLLSVSGSGLIGQDEQIIQSQKDFFVRILVSRYFREGDQTEIKLKVDNLTSKKMPTDLTLEISGEGVKVSDLLAGQSLKHSVEIPANESYVHTWKVKVPSILAPVKIKGVVIANKESDAEEKTISILPSRQRLIENSLAYLKDKQTTLSLKNWDKKDASRVHELVSLQIDPQLPIMLLNSVPTLVNYPYSCSEQLINKYVPLAIINSMYKKNPRLKTAVDEALKKTGTRKTVTLPWEEKDPRRLMELTETPWILTSKGMTSPHELISYLDASTIEKIRDEVFRDLKTRQTSSGGFSWFSGGTENLYITLVVLEGISEAAAYGVDYPKDQFEKAIDYVYRELPKYLKAQTNELQFLIFGTYIFTSFDSKRKNLSHNKEVAEAWIPFIEKHDAMITPLGHAYMAHIYKRLGMDKKSETSLKRAMDGSRKDDLIGIYWAPEERSWMWYSDSVEKHAFFLQTLIQLKPTDDRIDGLVQWLLFNRKGNEWKSTKATSKAIFSLMQYLKMKTQFKEKTHLSIDWGSRKEKFEFDPLAVDQKEPLRLVKTEGIKPNDGQVKITKTGALPVFAGLTWIYSTNEMVDASGSSVLDLKREFFLVQAEKQGPMKRVPLNNQSKISVGEEVEVVLTISSKSQVDYVHLKDPRGAGFESNSLLSGYRWETIGRYEEPRDSLMNFFFDTLPKGQYLMTHRFKATTPGVYRFNSATIQSMYAPELTAYSSSFQIEVVDN